MHSANFLTILIGYSIFSTNQPQTYPEFSLQDRLQLRCTLYLVLWVFKPLNECLIRTNLCSHASRLLCNNKCATMEDVRFEAKLNSFAVVVASISSSPRFESSHWQNLYLTLTVNCIEKAKINKKEAWIGPFKKNSFDYSVLVRQSNQQFYDKPILHTRPLCKNCASLCCAEGLLHWIKSSFSLSFCMFSWLR